MGEGRGGGESQGGGLLFSPAQGTTAAQDREQFVGLVNMLRDRLGSAWRDEWVARGLQTVPRQDLPAALGAFQEAGAEEEPGQPDRAREALAARAALAGLSPEARARALIEKLLAEEPIALQPDDLDDTLFAVMDALIAEAEERKRQLEALREQLQAMRRQVEQAQGPLRVLAEAGELGQHLLALLNAGSLENGRRVIEQHLDLISDEADALIERLLAVETRPQARQFVAAWREVLRGYRSVLAELAASGVAIRTREDLERALAERPDLQAKLFRALARQAGDETTARAIGLAATLQEFIQAPTWDATRRVVEEHPELLSDEADALLGQLLDAARNANDEGAIRTLEAHRALLRRCREVGIPRAFAEKLLSPEALAAAEAAGLTPEQALEAARQAAEMPAELREVLAELAASGIAIRTPEDLARALAERPDLRAKLEAAIQAMGGPPVPSQFQADLQQAQMAEQRYRRTGDRAALDEAAAAWERILGHPDFAAADERFQLAALNDAGGVFLQSYWARGRPQDLDRALALWQTAVQRTPPDHPDLPSILNNLGNGLRDRYARTGQLADLEEAIGTYRQAVQRTPPDHPDLPGFLNNLALGLRARYSRTGRLEDLEQAIGHWQRALDCLHAVIRTGLEAAPLVGQAAAITRRLVAAYLMLGRPAAALAAAEAGRGVRLRLDLARSGRVPAGLTDAEADEYRQLVQEVQAVASQRRLLDREGLPPAEHAARLAELGRRYAAATARLNALEARDPAFGRTLDAANMVALARAHDLTLVFLAPTDEAERGTVAFIVPLRGGGREGEKEGGGEPEVLELPGLTRQDLYNLLFALPEWVAWDPDAWPAMLDAPGSQPGWLIAYWLTHLARQRDDETHTNTYGPPARRLWHATMTRVLDELGRRLMAPLAARLQALGARRVVIVPGDHLGLLPLHAAPSPTPDPLPLPARPVAQPDRLPHLVGEGTLFADLFEVAYAPSAAALAQCLERAAAVGAQRRCAPTLVYAPTLVAVANPDGSLAFADDEVAAIARLFAGRARVAYGPAARRAWLLEHAPAADYLELSTHGRFAPGAPERSTLLLAHPGGHIWPLWRADVRERQPLAALQEGCERLTLDDVWAGRLPLPEGVVVTLDACETAQVEPGDEADESLGFPAAFLAAGARAVIASLWAVDDFATSLLMEETYRRMLAGERPAPALRAAGQWLRSLPKAEVLRRLDAVIAPLEAEKQAGAWNALPRVERGQRLYRLAALENRRDSLKDEPDPPFAHPVWWAAFAAYGA